MDRRRKSKQHFKVFVTPAIQIQFDKLLNFIEKKTKEQVISNVIPIRLGNHVKDCNNGRELLLCKVNVTNSTSYYNKEQCHAL